MNLWTFVKKKHFHEWAAREKKKSMGLLKYSIPKKIRYILAAHLGGYDPKKSSV
ncbi:MAG: hypothetical protein LBD03_03095 [Methanobrevibacter sp.]|jgi:hypothetical protein|nr:hypothetical protein [Candidatus Methanovirga procula]